ncbi:MAG: aryl-sulfate sulfotransferase [Chitinispirillaceae bacterium]|nr:aryl-sulfate sulfotransferase [Chitinispirillaceae bacterium]
MRKNRVRTIAAVMFFLMVAYTSGIAALASSMSTGGYVLTGAYGGPKTVLFDSTGSIAFQWDHKGLPNRLDGYSCYLLKNGNLLRTAIVPEDTVIPEMAPRQGIIEEIDREGKVVWRHTLADDTYMTHHDIKPMYLENGELHVLAVSFIVQTKEEMKATGVDTSLVKGIVGESNQFMLSEKIIEIDPKAAGGPKIVWEWRMPDHVIIGDSAAAHPERFSGTITSALWGQYKQWVHLNGLDYHPKLDMILFSSRLFSELYIIDHGTTTQEASGNTEGKRGKGGDILYRWGKPSNYKASGATTINVLHCVNWIPEGYPGAGNIIFFHNNVGGMMMAPPGAGTGSGEMSATAASSQSQVIEIKPPMDDNGNFIREAGKPFGPTQPTWIYAPTKNFSSFAMSSAFRLENGHTLAHLSYASGTGGGMGKGVLVEIDTNKQVVWTDTLTLQGEAVEKKNTTKYNPAKVMYYRKEYPGIVKLLGTSDTKHRDNTIAAGPVQSVPRIHQTAGSIVFFGVKGYKIYLVNLQGKSILSAHPESNTLRLPTGRMPAGLYYAKVTKDNQRSICRMIGVSR